MVIDKTLTGVGPVASNTQPSTKVSNPAGGPDFSDILGAQISAPKTAEPVENKVVGPVKFSNHALERMNSRGITMKPEDITALNNAVDRAASKGSRETLVLMDNTALIVNVRNKTVVTLMDRASMKENVFTNIDSTVVI